MTPETCDTVTAQHHQRWDNADYRRGWYATERLIRADYHSLDYPTGRIMAQERIACANRMHAQRHDTPVYWTCLGMAARWLAALQ